MPAVARIGDVTNHGGILKAPVATSVLTNGRASAHIGTAIYCPAGSPFPHGPTVVVTGIPGVLVEDIPVATVGSVTSCGAKVATGSGDVEAG
jgi:uncharacterized Zn-binding protein involved in type VI secretion